jgi:transposase
MTLKSYHNFIGIDIGKYEFVVNQYNTFTTQSFKNDPQGFTAFYKAFKPLLKKALVVLETTGGYELPLLLYLHQIKVATHRANTCQVKNFILSLGTLAKTDKLDAIALARYGYERHPLLSVFVANEAALKLYELAQRRNDLKKMIVQEKNRIQAPRCNQIVKESCKQMIALLEQQLKEMDQYLQTLVNADPVLKEKQKILDDIKGIGPVVAIALLCFMPELGTLSQKEVASLAGLAPYAQESGKYKGKRRIKGGRSEVRTYLFMAAMAASKSNSRFKVFYDSLIARGKLPMVALTALMRKILIVANARIKEITEQSLCVRHS